MLFLLLDFGEKCVSTAKKPLVLGLFKLGKVTLIITYFVFIFQVSLVIPAKAGILRENIDQRKIPAFAGMTKTGMTKTDFAFRNKQNRQNKKASFFQCELTPFFMLLVYSD